MAKKKISSSSPLVYSTDPGFRLQQNLQEPQITPHTEYQKLHVTLDKKQRAGKIVTLISGFEGKEEDILELGKKLKSFCGTGGSVKEGEIIIQGDNKEKIFQWLLKNGYKQVRKT